jgi:hypothetical protein
MYSEFFVGNLLESSQKYIFIRNAREWSQWSCQVLKPPVKLEIQQDKLEKVLHFCFCPPGSNMLEKK